MMNSENYYPFSYAPLPYDFAALEPHISRYTMYFHHDKHYKNYLDKLNAILSKHPLMQNIPLEVLTKMGDEELQRSAGGTYNHELYFSSLTPDCKEPSDNMRSLIVNSFGSEKEFRDELVDTGVGVNGSGWIWVVFTPEKTIELMVTPNQETVDLDKYTPLLLIDLWEHAYYLDRQHDRREYLSAVMSLLDWDKAEQRLNGGK
ncbi:MAG: superoxide dismutase [Oscillospiraceae bacterium]|nr:superoxide dismutase [Oscillospiraceae bacterium]